VTLPVRPNAEAEAEFRYYISRYENESDGLGNRLWSEIQAAIDLISDHPAIGEELPSRVREPVRRVPLRHFPFLLVYREYSDHLEIVALAHTSRQARYWRGRLLKYT
jgi:plasmid stabilization system protein ParE